jgi:hypothetical protein
MTSFHHTTYESGFKDHPRQQKVKVFAKHIERLFPKEPIGSIRWPIYYGLRERDRLINMEIRIRDEMCRAYPFINTTRYLREHFRCPDCISKSKHPNKEKVKRETKFCEKCFNQNVKVKGFEFKINFLVNVIDDANFGKIRYKRTTKPMVKKALENINSERRRVIRRIGEIEETLTQICEIYRYMILFGGDVYPCSYYNHYIYKLRKFRDTYCKLWKNLKKYLDNIPEIRIKYGQLKEAQSRKDMCTGCFKCKDELTSTLRHTKKGMICKDCQEDEQIIYYSSVEDMDKMRIEARKLRASIKAEESREKQREIMFKIKTECPICNDIFRQFDTTQMMKARCGNHYFCVSCADSWRSSCLANTGREARCPMCRGDF